MKAKKLHVKVKRDGDEKVNLTFPLTAVKNLTYLIPSSVLESLKTKSIDIIEIISKAQESNYVPQILFELNIDAENKYYKVWLA